MEYYPFLDTLNWSSICSLCSTTSSCSNYKFKTTQLQYSIVHRSFGCNYNLYLWNIVESSHCWYCNEVDTLEHYFFYCSQSKSMWNEVEKIVNAALGIHINFTVLEIQLDIPCRKNSIHCVLNLILFTKQIIYTQKQLNVMFPTLLFRSLRKKAETEILLLKSRQDSVCSLIAMWESKYFC